MATSAYDLGKTILRASGVSLTLGGNRVLRDVDLEVKDIIGKESTRGQVVALLGPSGMGKTRLFRILAGLDAPDAGTVLMGDPPAPVRRGRVGVVAQRYPLLMHRSVLDNLAVAGRQAGLSKDEAAAKGRSFLERLGLADKARLYPAQLSGGQQQRVAIAQQFMCSEHFLLMDEPFSGLDPIAVTKMSALITEMANQHTLNTIIVVTHDVAAAIEVADTLWLLGRDRDPAGNPIPGARVQATIDLLQRGLAWRKDVKGTPEFAQVYSEVVRRFAEL